MMLDEKVIKERAIWWIELLFNLQKFEYMKNGNDDKVTEVDAVQKYIMEKLEEE